MNSVITSSYALLVFAFTLMHVHQSIGFDSELRNAFEENHGWKFPRERPFQYYHSTKDIPQNVVPVPVNSLPYRNGVWLLNYEDSTGLPKIFVPNMSGMSNKSVLSFGSGMPFHSITIKALAFGNVQLDLITYDFDARGVNEDEIYPLFGTDTNCTSELGTENINDLRWIKFDANFSPIFKTRLEAEVLQPNSFLLIDDVTVHFMTEEPESKILESHISPEDLTKWRERTYKKKMSCGMDIPAPLELSWDGLSNL